MCALARCLLGRRFYSSGLKDVAMGRDGRLRLPRRQSSSLTSLTRIIWPFDSAGVSPCQTRFEENATAQSLRAGPERASHCPMKPPRVVICMRGGHSNLPRIRAGYLWQLVGRWPDRGKLARLGMTV